MTLKQMEVTEKKIGDSTFYIKKFPAFTAANISGDLVSVLAPVIGGIAAVAGKDIADGDKQANILDTDIEDALPAFSQAFSSLSGDKFERLMKSHQTELQRFFQENGRPIWRSYRSPQEGSEYKEWGELDTGRFTDLEMRMYILIKARIASKLELETVYDLDEALKLYALYCMDLDIERGQADKLKAESR